MNNFVNLVSTPINLFLLGILAVVVVFGVIGIWGSRKGSQRRS